MNNELKAECCFSLKTVKSIDVKSQEGSAFGMTLMIYILHVIFLLHIL